MIQKVRYRIAMNRNAGEKPWRVESPDGTHYKVDSIRITAPCETHAEMVGLPGVKGWFIAEGTLSIDEKKSEATIS